MKTYLQSIKSYPLSIQEALIQEAPHTKIRVAPQELDYLTKGIVDFGFENLGLSEKEFKIVMLGFSQHGVGLTGFDGLKVRADGTFGAVIERIGRGTVPMLPENWQDAVIVIDPDTNQIVHAGALVRSDQM